MGLLINGEWADQWYDTKATGGKFVRTEAQFRNWITADGSAGPSGKGGLNVVSSYFLLADRCERFPVSNHLTRETRKHCTLSRFFRVLFEFLKPEAQVRFSSVWRCPRTTCLCTPSTRSGVSTGLCSSQIGPLGEMLASSQAQSRCLEQL